MSDGSETRAEIIVIGLFVVLNFAWTVIQFWDYINEKFKPPEEKDVFDGQSKLMLEETYKHSVDSAKNQSQDEHIRIQIGDMHGKVDDLHQWHAKEDQDGIKVWYVPRRIIGMIEESSRMLHEVVNALHPGPATPLL